MLFISLDDSGDLHPHSGESYLVYGGFATEERKYLEKCVKLVMRKGIAIPELRYNKVGDKFEKLLLDCLEKRRLSSLWGMASLISLEWNLELILGYSNLLQKGGMMNNHCSIGNDDKPFQGKRKNDIFSL